MYTYIVADCSSESIITDISNDIKRRRLADRMDTHADMNLWRKVHFHVALLKKKKKVMTIQASWLQSSSPVDQTNGIDINETIS